MKRDATRGKEEHEPRGRVKGSLRNPRERFREAVLRSCMQELLGEDVTKLSGRNRCYSERRKLRPSYVSNLAKGFEKSGAVDIHVSHGGTRRDAAAPVSVLSRGDFTLAFRELLREAAAGDISVAVKVYLAERVRGMKAHRLVVAEMDAPLGARAP